MNLYELKMPQLWIAGYVSESSLRQPDDKPIYFECAECEQIKPIAGFLANGPSYDDILIVTKHGQHFNMMYCKECLPKIKERWMIHARK